MTATGQRRCTGDRLLIPQGQMHQCSGFTKACPRLRPARATLHHRLGELLRYFDQQLQSGEQRTC